MGIIWLCAKLPPRPSTAVDLAVSQEIESVDLALGLSLQHMARETQPASGPHKTVSAATEFLVEHSASDESPTPLVSLVSLGTGLHASDSTDNSSSVCPRAPGATLDHNEANCDVLESELPPMVFANPGTLSPEVLVVSPDVSFVSMNASTDIATSDILSSSPAVPVTASEPLTDSADEHVSCLNFTHGPDLAVEPPASAIKMAMSVLPQTVNEFDDTCQTSSPVERLQDIHEEYDLDDDNKVVSVEVASSLSTAFQEKDNVLADEIVVSDWAVLTPPVATSVTTIDLDDAGDKDDQFEQAADDKDHPDDPPMLEIRESTIPAAIGMEVKYGKDQYLLAFLPEQPKKISASLKYQLDHELRYTRSEKREKLHLSLNHLHLPRDVKTPGSLESSISACTYRSEVVSPGRHPPVTLGSQLVRTEDHEEDHRRAHTEPLFPSIPYVRAEDAGVHPLPTVDNLDCMVRCLQEVLRLSPNIDRTLCTYRLAEERRDPGRGNVLALISRSELRKTKSVADMHASYFSGRAYLVRLNRVP